MRRDPHDPSAALLVKSVLDAAVQLLVAHGQQGLTTNRVAERAGVSIGSVYEYFPNKEAIIAVLSERYLADYVDVFTSVIRTPGTYGDVAARVVESLVEKYRSQPRIHRHLFEMLGATDMHTRYGQVIDRSVTLVGYLLQAAGVPMDRAANAAFAIVHSANGMCIGLYVREIVDPTEQGRAFVEMIRGHLQRLGVHDTPVVT